MSDETDLDWLARNVHVWREGKCEVLVRRPRNVDTIIWSSVLSDTGWITKEQWLARRAELQNKPTGWPDGANWLAQDKDGEWYFYKDAADNPPQNHGEENWFSDEAGDIRCRRIGEVLGDWRDTLEKRQEQDEFEPFVSVEDSKEQDMKQDNGWFERGELPQVGMAVQLWHGGTYAYDCELIAKRGNNFVLWNLTWDRPDSADCMMCEFKPIPTERDVLIEIIKKTDDTDDRIADAILAAGFKLGAA